MPREKLKLFRKTINKTNEEMAKMLALSLSMYKQMECGAKNPSLKTMQKFKEEFPTANISEIFLQ